MAHTAGARGLASLALDTPVVAAQLGSRVSALAAGLLLLVEAAITTTTA